MSQQVRRKQGEGKRAKRLAALAAGLLFAGLLAEVGARTLLGAPIPERYPQVRYVPHPERGFALVPGDRSYTYDCEVRVNAYGLRGPEIPPKEPGEQRILLLGDSLTFGHGVSEEQTIGAYLQAELERRAPLGEGTYRVINGGHQGFATRQEVDLLVELGPALEPDLVLLLWLWNDIQEKVVQRPPAGTPPPPPITEPPATPFAFRARQWARKSALVLWLNDLEFRASFPAKESITRALQKVERQLGRYASEAKRLGSRAAFVVLPDARALVTPNPTLEIDARATELARGHGLVVISTAEAVRALIAEHARLPVLSFDGHYDGSGNAALARGIAEGLIRERLVTGP